MQSSIASGFRACWQRLRVVYGLAERVPARVSLPVRFMRWPFVRRRFLALALPAMLSVLSSLGASAAHAQQSDPRKAATALEQANRLVKEGKPQEALQALDLALAASPRDAQLRFLYGVILVERKRVSEALDVFQQLTEDFPEIPEPYNNLAVLYAQRGDLDRARAALENAVRALPAYALAHENLGDVYLRMAARSYELATLADRNSDAAKSKLTLARELMTRVQLK